MGINFLDEIKKQLYNNPNKIAYCCGHESITYHELLTKAFGLANYLLKKGRGPVAIYGQKQAGMLISILGCLFSKRAYVPIDSALPNKRVKYLVDYADVQLMIALDACEIDDIEIMHYEFISKIKPCNNPPHLPFDLNQIAYIIFTSGSTGDAKCVPISFANLSNFIKWIRKLPALNEISDVVMNQASFSFDLSVADMFFSLTTGRQLFALALDVTKNVAAAFEEILKSNASLLVCTPTFIRVLLSISSFSAAYMPKLQCVFFCGEVLQPQTVKKLFLKFPQIKIINAYGPTEATCAVSSVLIDKGMLNCESLPIGELDTAAVDISIEKSKVYPHETYGEIVLKGKSVFCGYLKEEKNNGCYKTGDIGYIDGNRLYFLQRKDRQLKYKGYRIHPAEIERALLSVEGIEAAIVIPQLRNEQVVRLVAFLELATTKNAKQIKTMLSELVPAYMLPTVIVFLYKLPLNANQKTDYNFLWRHVNG
jgi:D-alanine--poly(phosphoribitol) ligase subunit 1